MASLTQQLQTELSSCHEQIDKLNQSLEEKQRKIEELQGCLIHTSNLLTKQQRVCDAYKTYMDKVDDARNELSKSFRI